jgi:voltage-gated potassium channel
LPVISTFFALLRLFRALRRAMADPQSRALVLLTAAVLAGGTLFYSTSQGWSMVDAFYFSVTTLTTVGYGDLSPHGTGARLFTVAYVLTGIGIVGAFIGVLARDTGDSPIGRRKGHRRERPPAGDDGA